VLNAADWKGSLVLVIGAEVYEASVPAGGLSGPITGASATIAASSDRIVVSGPDSAWQVLCRVVPPPPFSDVFSASKAGEMEVTPVITSASRHTAVRRFFELLRHASNDSDPSPVPFANVSRHGEHDHAIGRYVHLDLDGADNRVYYEQAGQGIPLLCQHTAGSDARQWRHILEDESVTSRYRVIAYDLPYHGRSLPPESKAWWAQEYVLTTAGAMAVPLALSSALGLEAPVFIGSSIGGMLALDLARFHPGSFRAVIALEGALRSSGAQTADGMARISRYRKQERLMDPALPGARMRSMMSPTASEAARQEVILHYSQGAPGVFPGDLYFYALDHDLRGEGKAIDTSTCPVYLLTGEYDSEMVPMTMQAASEIPGARATIMSGLGHFPMCEDYRQLMGYLGPILDEIAARPGTNAR
jgi:pimeloyl-ACP methyl ester carboxylesterase